MEKIRVFLSDPKVLFREGMHFTLSGEEDFEVIGETTNNEDAFAFIEANPPSVTILNMKDGRLDGSEITRRIKRNLPSVSVILVVDSDDEELLFSAMRSGASAHLTRDTDREYLVSVIREVTRGSQPITEALLIPRLASRTLTEFEDLATLNQQLGNLFVHLSPKESEILKGIVSGNGIEYVAAELNINEETIRRNLRLILSKLVANDHAKAVIEIAQIRLPAIITGATKTGKPSAEYVIKEEFTEFKESLIERFKSFTAELA